MALTPLERLRNALQVMPGIIRVRTQLSPTHYPELIATGKNAGREFSVVWIANRKSFRVTNDTRRGRPCTVHAGTSSIINVIQNLAATGRL